MAAALSLTKSPKRSGTGTATVLSDGGGGVRGCGGTTWAVPTTDTSSRARSPRPKGRSILRITTSARGGEPRVGGGVAPHGFAEAPGATAACAVRRRGGGG